MHQTAKLTRGVPDGALGMMVIVLPEPRSDILPQSLPVMAAIAGWLAVLVLPVLVAGGVWKLVNRRRVAQRVSIRQEPGDRTASVD